MEYLPFRLFGLSANFSNSGNALKRVGFQREISRKNKEYVDITKKIRIFVRDFNMVGTKRKILSCFLVALFVSYYAETVLFSHSHIIGGTPIAHSHVHKESHHDTESGNHTEQSITLIAQISHFQFIDFSCNFILKPIQFPLHEDKFMDTIHWL